METKPFTKDEIDLACVSNEVVTSMLNLFKTVYPDWDKIVKLKHFPKVNRTTDFYILDKMTEMIKKYPENNPTRQEFMHLWVNKGFGIEVKMEDWTVGYEPDEIEYLEENDAE